MPTGGGASTRALENAVWPDPLLCGVVSGRTLAENPIKPQPRLFPARSPQVTLAFMTLSYSFQTTRRFASPGTLNDVAVSRRLRLVCGLLAVPGLAPTLDSTTVPGIRGRSRRRHDKRPSLTGCNTCRPH